MRNEPFDLEMIRAAYSRIRNKSLGHKKATQSSADLNGKNTLYASCRGDFPDKPFEREQGLC